MDIYELRNAIMVYVYGPIRNEYTTIQYSINAIQRHEIKLTLNELCDELVAIGSLHEDYTTTEVENYKLSQWDALNIAIRFELARQQEKDLEKSDIFNAITNIIKPGNE